MVLKSKHIILWYPNLHFQNKHWIPPENFGFMLGSCQLMPRQTSLSFEQTGVEIYGSRKYQQRQSPLMTCTTLLPPIIAIFKKRVRYQMQITNFIFPQADKQISELFKTKQQRQLERSFTEFKIPSDLSPEKD